MSQNKTTSTSSVQVCKNCKKDFTIEPDDFAFYEKIAVPPPTHCPECRQQRRYAWRNDRNLYRRTCDLCGKSTVALYQSDKPFKVYCQPCWWSDAWDATTYGRDYDPAKPMFQQLADLQKVVPRIAMLGKNSVRSEYTNHSSDNKDCFMGSSLVDCENVMYSYFVFHSKDCVDCMMIYVKSERCYECVDVDGCYQCQFCELCNQCAQCSYCYDCRGCTDCFLSSNLRSKSNYFLNQQYSKEEYRKKVAEFNFGSYETRKKLYQQFLDLKKDSLHKYATIERSTNCTGDHIFNSKNVRNGFSIDKAEDVSYTINAEEIKDSMDIYQSGFKIELLYECNAQIRNYNSKFCNCTYDVSHLEYCDLCFNSQNFFGCIGLKKGEYMILNKKYSPEDFKILKARIISDMRERGEYGEFFPISLSPFALNETHVALFMPEKIQEKAVVGSFGKETMQPDVIPDDIKDVPDDIAKQVLKCVTCSRNYNIVEPELAFYRREVIPIPRQCYPCRDAARIALRAPRKLYHRSCMCALSHPHHTGQCPNEFETPYAPDRLETVYCESCYQQEVV